jgi:hypothetical protein
MHLETSRSTGTDRHRAEDDLFHFDRSNAPRTTDCDFGLVRAKASARAWVIGLRPRWLTGAVQPLVRPRGDD